MALALDAAILLAAGLAVTAWFASAHRGVVILSAAGLVALVLLRGWRARRAGPRSPRAGRTVHLETLLCLAAAVAYRLPALLHPWGWVNRDGAYGAFVALHLLQGHRPAPVFTEGANYQGTLKGHLAALLWHLTGVHDLSWLMTAASLGLFLVFVAATMALTRRIGGRLAAAVAGLYLALSPRFVTVFSLNCVGQYVDVLALGGLALALLARLLQEDRHGREARGLYVGIGGLLGAAFWQQPVALAYLLTAAAVLLLRRRTWRDGFTLLVPVGVVLGAWPVVLWNLRHGGASGEMLIREPALFADQLDALPYLVGRTLTVSLPVLVGLSPGHPWADRPGVALLAVVLVPGLTLAYVILTARRVGRAARSGDVEVALLPLLLSLSCLGLFWAVAAGHVYSRPRYLLPLVAGVATSLGVVLGVLVSRSRTGLLGAAVLMTALLAFGIAGTLPRLRASEGLADYYRQIVQAVERTGIRTGYADFSLAAPVTMFTAERIVLSPALGPTPAYESELHARKVATEGPDGFVLRPEDDVSAFAAALNARGIEFQLDREPVPIFHHLSRRPGSDELAGFRPALGAGGSAPE
jgi:hypothetical protein